MRKKYTPKTIYDRDILYTCDYSDFTAKIKTFWDTKALFCDGHLIFKDDDVLYLQVLAGIYNMGYSQGLDDAQEKIKEKLFNS